MHLMELMDEAEADVLAFMTVPKAHRLQIHSTNPLERLNAEVKRRTDCDICGDHPTIHELIDYELFCGLRPAA